MTNPHSTRRTLHAVAWVSTMTLGAVSVATLGAISPASAGRFRAASPAVTEVLLAGKARGAKPGARCAKAGAKASYRGQALVCKKVRGKLIWVVQGGAAGVRWAWNGSKWQSSGGTPPACPSVPYQLPVPLDSVRAVLYPGQVRGGDYKPHGGFLLNVSDPDSVSVRAPIAGSLTRASRYYEKNLSGQAELQFLVEVVNSCGLMFRFDHLRSLPGSLAAVVNALPAPVLDQSQTTNITPPVSISAGQVLGSGAGFTTNPSLDFGMYNLRAANPRATRPGELSGFAICWFDRFGSANEATLKSLPPGDGGSGSASDFC